MQRVLEKANAFLKSWKFLKTPIRQKWSVRIDKNKTSWVNARSKIFEAVLLESSLPSHACKKCKENAIAVVCHDCHDWKYLCSYCDVDIHCTLPFHDRSVIVDGCSRPVPPSISVDVNGDLVNIGMLCTNLLFLIVNNSTLYMHGNKQSMYFYIFKFSNPF